MKGRENASDREFGALGEQSASRYLSRKGFRTVDKNVYVGRKEIDLIVKGHGMILFAEVKTRRQIPRDNAPFGRPGTAVNAKKRENLLYAVRGYIHRNPSVCEGLQPRIDIIEVYADPRCDRFKVLEIRHIENAVTAD